MPIIKFQDFKQLELKIAKILKLAAKDDKSFAILVPQREVKTGSPVS